MVGCQWNLQTTGSPGMSSIYSWPLNKGIIPAVYGAPSVIAISVEMKVFVAFFFTKISEKLLFALILAGISSSFLRKTLTGTERIKICHNV